MVNNGWVDDDNSYGIPVSTKTASYSATLNDCVILVDTTAGNVTITLPDVTSISGKNYTISKVSTDANTVSIVETNGALVDGCSQYTIATYRESITLISDTIAYFGR